MFQTADALFHHLLQFQIHPLKIGGRFFVDLFAVGFAKKPTPRFALGEFDFAFADVFQFSGNVAGFEEIQGAAAGGEG